MAGAVLSDRTYRHLYPRQVVRAFGHGLATMAHLALWPYRFSGAGSGGQWCWLPSCYDQKWWHYVVLAPIGRSLCRTFNHAEALLVTLDLVRAAVALALPFREPSFWQIYILHSSSCNPGLLAAFTPTFQAPSLDVCGLRRAIPERCPLFPLA